MKMVALRNRQVSITQQKPLVSQPIKASAVRLDL